MTVRIENQGKGVGRIEWRVNGVTASVATKPGDGGPVYTISRDLALDPGDNTIQVIAYNDSNLLASPPAQTRVTLTGPVDMSKPKLHILTIGIDKYVDEKLAPPLNLAENDAKAFAESIKRAAAGLYDEDNILVTPVLGKDATRANLERVIERIKADTNPRDTFILFASGHGYSSRGRFYLIPQDYQSGAVSLVDGAIGQDQLQDWLANRIKARKAIILLDTCESGALVAGHRRSRIDDGPTSEAAVGRLREATGRPVLTGAAAGKWALEGTIDDKGERHGVFTLALLKALREGDTHGNGLVELSELVAYVQTAVPNIAAGVDDEGKPGKQAARFGSRGEDFVVARRLQ